ncbi:MAG: hypothetical protein E7326_07945 [Clostridiales bacterium]|nr:hypothetical protein [Clostridiales bacterium]
MTQENAKPKRRSPGRWISSLGTLLICAALVCNSFSLLSAGLLRALVLIGVAVQITALIVALRTGRF